MCLEEATKLLQYTVDLKPKFPGDQRYIVTAFWFSCFLGLDNIIFQFFTGGWANSMIQLIGLT